MAATGEGVRKAAVFVRTGKDRKSEDVWQRAAGGEPSHRAIDVTIRKRKKPE